MNTEQRSENTFTYKIVLFSKLEEKLFFQERVFLGKKYQKFFKGKILSAESEKYKKFFNLGARKF